MLSFIQCDIFSHEHCKSIYREISMQDDKEVLIGFPKRLLETLNGTRESLTEPDREIEPGEVDLGTLTNSIAQALYSLSVEVKGSLGKILPSPEDLLERGEPEEKLAKFADLEKLETQRRIVDGVLWEIIGEIFPKVRDVRVTAGLRKGWKVIIFKRSMSPISCLVGEIGNFFGR